jgi:segregation and condensation protein B
VRRLATNLKALLVWKVEQRSDFEINCLSLVRAVLIEDIRYICARLAVAGDVAVSTSWEYVPHLKSLVQLREVGGGWRLYVRAEYDWAVRMFIANENPTKLSQAALETLAVIAYKQPISSGQVASIRAVNVDSVVRTLLSRNLITELYTDSETGAINYGTPDLMLEVLGINSLDELPPVSPHLPDANSDFDA